MILLARSTALLWQRAAVSRFSSRLLVAGVGLAVGVVALRSNGATEVPAPAVTLPAAAVSVIKASAPPAPVRALASAPEEPAEPTLPITPLGEEEAARHLAQALQDVLGELPSEAAVSILWAHWAHETGRGRRMIGNNFGGVKGESESGGAFIWTREATASGKELVRRTFRVYASAELGALDYVQLLADRYGAAFRAAREGRVTDFADHLGARGYYTEDVETYRRAVKRLARECAERSLARQVLRAMRAHRMEATARPD